MCIAGDNKHPVGEVGTLTEVHISILDPNHPASRRPYNRVFVFMEYEQSTYLGCVLFDDPAACLQIGQILLGQCGRTIKQVGEMDLSQLL